MKFVGRVMRSAILKTVYTYLSEMKSLISLLSVTIIVVQFAAAQSVSKRLSLNESLELALANNNQIKKNKLDRQALERKVKEARSGALPDVNMGVNFDWYPLLPTQILPGEPFGRGRDTYFPVQFGQPFQLSGIMTVEYPLLNEAARRQSPALDVTRCISDLMLVRSREEVIFNTATVYYQALQTEQLLRAVNANIDKLDALRGMAELQLANGFAIPTDVKRIRVARTNLETQRQNLLAAIGGLRQTLQFYCGIPYEEPLDLVNDSEQPAADSLRWLGIRLEEETITEYRLLANQMELTRIQRRAAHAESFPTVHLYGAAAAQSFQPDVNFFSPDREWYGMAAAGVKLKMPLLDGFRVHNKAMGLRIEEQKLDEDRRQLAAGKRLEYSVARTQLVNALQALRTQSDNVALAQEITDKLLLQYKEGVASLTDLLNAQTALSEAVTNYWQQAFGYKLSVLKLLKGAGKLEELLND